MTYNGVLFQGKEKGLMPCINPFYFEDYSFTYLAEKPLQQRF
ncbi:hypothetical protein JCM19237_4493 [Photobacterium aphoticum]|uniref:Uncharacterized protein n=1 Tax=Photobacterium aphoticum TaxID=754436 RepID=A0A090QYH8_9GAMM|nr:hypothetical protein JCM19237_4493 [Photobacterium aphoticum]